MLSEHTKFYLDYSEINYQLKSLSSKFKDKPKEILEEFIYLLVTNKDKNIKNITYETCNEAFMRIISFSDGSIESNKLIKLFLTIDSFRNNIVNFESVSKRTVLHVFSSNIFPLEIIHQIKQTKSIDCFLKKVDMDNYSWFESSCKYGNIVLIKKIIKEFGVKNYYNYQLGFKEAIDNNRLEVIKYLLSKKQIKNKIILNFEDNWAIKKAIWNIDLELVKILLKTNKVDIYAKNSISFKMLCEKINFYSSDLENTIKIMSILKYLIYEYNIILTKDIKLFIKNYPEILKMFELRAVNKKLNEKLKKKKVLKKINKI